MSVSHIQFVEQPRIRQLIMSHDTKTAVTPARSETDSSRRVTSGDTMNLFSPGSGHGSPAVLGSDSDNDGDLSETLVTNEDMNAIMGTDQASYKPVLDINARPHRDGLRWTRKNEYDPPMPYQERERLIFALNGRYRTRGRSLGEKLDSIMSVEQTKTPGINPGHGDNILGFGYAHQPFETSYMGGNGCGAVRTVQ